MFKDLCEARMEVEKIKGVGRSSKLINKAFWAAVGSTVDIPSLRCAAAAQ
jgi:hypothetical protein